MAGTVKLCVPELAPAGALAEFTGCAEAVTEGLAAAERRCVGEVAGVVDDPGVLACADVGDAVGVSARAADEPPEAADAAEGVDPVDPLAPHAVRPAPPMTAAIITAGTRHILMPLPSVE
ncbi:MAG: hypothetical protein JO345_12450 [Streptosporangiaceae bacterium]|nr:hypothetical protein [Streptosporangiaceae bacterium]